MVETKCAICNEFINENNNTKEHIIPNSIGGKKIVKNFICDSCNNVTGETWDSELFKQLAPFCTIFGIKRHRGKVAPLKVKDSSGEEFLQFKDGTFQPLRPKSSIVETDKKLGITIQARTIEEAEQILKGIAKKYNLSEEKIQTIKKDFVMRDFYLGEPIGHNLNIESATIGKSMVKSALALAFDAGINPFECEMALDYLKTDIISCYRFYYRKDILNHRLAGLPLHCIKIHANSKTKQILGYVEYFGFLRLIVFLSESYQGEDREIIYAINPMDGQELNIEINLNFSVGEIQEIKNVPYDVKNFELALGAILQKAVSFSEERERKRVVEKAFEYASQFNDPLKSDEENASFMAKKFTESLQPYIQNKVKNKKL